MQNALTGLHAARRITRGLGVLAVAALLASGLAACTTVEGTNALTDVGTFEREVMSSTARGIGLIPGEAPKEDLTVARAPLVLPKSGTSLPAPTTAAAAQQLPANSDTVRIDTANLSEADMQRLRNAKVVDLRSLSGRPLTEAEARALTARMQAANMTVVANAERPLYLPPDEYFTRVGDADLICRTPAGELVNINDERCPSGVRNALKRTLAGPSNVSASTTANTGNTMSNAR